MRVSYRTLKSLPRNEVLALYRSVQWSAAKKPARLMRALRQSHTVVSAWVDGSIVGLGNAISDASLVVYYPHLLVSPGFQRLGIGREIMIRLLQRYRGFHQHMLVADERAIEFYRKCGFARAGNTESMWIYAGDDHRAKRRQ